MKNLQSLMVVILATMFPVMGQQKDLACFTNENAAVVLIETQNEWMHPEGKLRKLLIKDEEMMKRSISNIEKIVNHARNEGIPVVHLGLRFQEGYPELANGEYGLRKAIPNAGTFPVGEFGSQFYEPVKPLADEFVVTGRVGASGFTGSNLDIFLRNNNIKTIYLAGYATHVCVESTLRDAHDMGYHAILVEDACAAFNKEQHQHVLEHVVHHFGGQMTTSAFVTVYK